MIINKKIFTKIFTHFDKKCYKKNNKINDTCIYKKQHRVIPINDKKKKEHIFCIEWMPYINHSITWNINIINKNEIYKLDGRLFFRHVFIYCCEYDNLNMVKFFFNKYDVPKEAVINKRNNFLLLLIQYNSIKIFKYFSKKYDIKTREIVNFLSITISDVLFKFIIKKYNIQINNIGLTFLSDYLCNCVVDNNKKMFKYVVNVSNIPYKLLKYNNYYSYNLLDICVVHYNLNMFKYLIKKYNIALDELMKHTYIINNYYFKKDIAKYLINKFGKCNSDNIFGAKQLFKSYLHFYCHYYDDSNNYYYNMLIFLIIKFNLSVKTCMDYSNYITLMYLSEYRFNKFNKMILKNYAILNYKNINYNSIFTLIY